MHCSLADLIAVNFGKQLIIGEPLPLVSFEENI